MLPLMPAPPVTITAPVPVEVLAIPVVLIIAPLAAICTLVMPPVG